MPSGFPTKVGIARYGRHVSKVPIADIASRVRSPRLHKRTRAYSGNPTFRRPSKYSFMFDDQPRAMDADIVKADRPQANASPPHAPQRHVRGGQKRTRGSDKLPERRGSGVGLSSRRRWPRQSDQAQSRLSPARQTPGVAADLPGSCEWHVQSSGPLPPAAPQEDRPSLWRSMREMNWD